MCVDSGEVSGGVKTYSDWLTCVGLLNPMGTRSKTESCCKRGTVPSVVDQMLGNRAINASVQQEAEPKDPGLSLQGLVGASIPPQLGKDPVTQWKYLSVLDMASKKLPSCS